MKRNEMSLVRKDLAPAGTLRAAINLGNAVLAQKIPGPDGIQGISVEIARELAGSLEVELECIPFKSAGAVVEALEQDAWTVAFLAIDPKRAEKIAFTESYCAIEGSYLVRTESRFFANKDVDQPGVRIAVGKNAAYDLYLSRNLESAELVRAATTPGALELFVEENLEVAAGVKLPLLNFADKNPSFRVLDEPFMAINQAMCTPQGHPAGFDYLKTFIAEIKNNGTLEQIFRKFDQSDLL